MRCDVPITEKSAFSTHSLTLKECQFDLYDRRDVADSSRKRWLNEKELFKQEKICQQCLIDRSEAILDCCGENRRWYCNIFMCNLSNNLGNRSILMMKFFFAVFLLMFWMHCDVDWFIGTNVTTFSYTISWNHILYWLKVQPL